VDKGTKLMSDTIFDEIEQAYPLIIAVMPAEFDAHDFILKLAQAHQRLYVRGLALYAETDRPFQILHGILAQRLHKFEPLITKIGERNSPDIFRQTNSASLWKKRT
jgi:hypothetical protein